MAINAICMLITPRFMSSSALYRLVYPVTLAYPVQCPTGISNVTHPKLNSWSSPLPNCFVHSFTTSVGVNSGFPVIFAFSIISIRSIRKTYWLVLPSVYIQNLTPSHYSTNGSFGTATTVFHADYCSCLTSPCPDSSILNRASRWIFWYISQILSFLCSECYDVSFLPE